jgi:hypothetical protein
MERMPKARADKSKTIAPSVNPISAVGTAAASEAADKYPKALSTVFITPPISGLRSQRKRKPEARLNVLRGLKPRVFVTPK